MSVDRSRRSVFLSYCNARFRIANDVTRLLSFELCIYCIGLPSHWGKPNCTALVQSIVQLINNNDEMGNFPIRCIYQNQSAGNLASVLSGYIHYTVVSAANRQLLFFFLGLLAEHYPDVSFWRPIYLSGIIIIIILRQGDLSSAAQRRGLSFGGHASIAALLRRAWLFAWASGGHGACPMM